MAEYIEKEKLLEAYNDVQKNAGMWRFETLVNYIPAADVAPVVHAKWFLLNECSNEGVYCSKCKKKVYRSDYANQKVKSKYCPNCGARMDGDSDA